MPATAGGIVFDRQHATAERLMTLSPPAIKENAMTRLLHPLTRLGPLAAIVLLSLPGVALAGGKATISMGQPEGSTPTGESTETTIITWHDTDTMRMDIGDTTDYMLVRDGKMYMVSQSDGEMEVMDLSGMSAMVQGMASQELKDENPFGSIESVKATGATATVAGVKGRVYRMSWTNPDGSRKTGDAVLTDDPLVVEMTQAYLGSMSAMGGPELTASFENSLPDDDRGLLRMDEQFQIDSISRIDPPATTFELPAEPMDMRSLMEGMMDE